MCFSLFAAVYRMFDLTVVLLHCTGVTPVTFSQFASLFVLKVPWFTPGYSYCRWWGVTCCLTASGSVLPTCTRGFQSVGMLTLIGQFLSCICCRGTLFQIQQYLQVNKDTFSVLSNHSMHTYNRTYAVSKLCVVRRCQPLRCAASHYFFRPT